MASRWAASALVMVGGSGRRHARRRRAARLAQPEAEAAAAPSRPAPPRRPRRCPTDARRVPGLAGVDRRPALRLALGDARSAPAGDPASGLMVLTDMPSAEDAARGLIAAARPARCSTGCWRRSGRSRETDLSRPLCRRSARRPARIDRARRQRRCAEIARHHVGLVAPRALLLFGDICAQGPARPAGDARRAAAGTNLETPAGPDQGLW